MRKALWITGVVAGIGLLSPVGRVNSLASDATPATGGDWPQWCGNPDRNMVSDATGLPTRFDDMKGTHAPRKTLHGVKWATRLGAAAYGSPVISGGKVYVGGCASGVGSQNAVGILWCLRESDGHILWKLRSPWCAKLFNRSWGITSTPTIEGDRVYLLGHLGEVLCLNANGLAGGNTGPFQDEAALLATNRLVVRSRIEPDGQRNVECTPGVPGELTPADADIIWRYDLIANARCWPFNALNAAILVRGDRLYVPTCSVLSRGGGDTADEDIDAWKQKTGRTHYPSPNLIVLDKHTGNLLAEDDTGAFDESFHGAHSSPALGAVHGKDLVFWGSGSGVCYAFDPEFEPGRNGKPGILRTVWKFNCVDPATYEPGSENKRPHRRIEIIATPVFYKGRVYVAIGNDLLLSGADAPQGRLVCIDATQTGDVTRIAKVWSFEDIRSSSSTVAIHDGLLYTADAAGTVYCLDADNGRLYWKYKTKPVWGSPLVADGKVYVPTHGRGLLVFKEGKTLRLVGEGNGGLELDGSPAAANGTLYVAAWNCLYALRKPALDWKIVLAIAAVLAVVGAAGAAVATRRARPARRGNVSV